MYLSGLEVWLNHVNPLAHLNLIKWELQHGESRWARRTMCSFEMTVGPCVSHRAWLLCPLHHSLSPQCFLHLPLCSANHELPCLTRDIANYIHQLHSSEYRSVSAMIPCYFTVPNMSKLSILSHHRPSPAFQAHPCHTWLLLSCFCSSLLFQEPTKELVQNSWAD